MRRAGVPVQRRGPYDGSPTFGGAYAASAHRRSIFDQGPEKALNKVGIVC